MTETPACLLRDVPLAAHTSLGVGGPAACFLDAQSPDELRAALAWAEGQGLPIFLLGGGSNVLISDAGWPGLVLRSSFDSCVWQEESGSVLVRAAAGLDWDAFVRQTIDRGLAGLECTSGIPGLVGAAPIQNVGAYGQEVAETIVEVDVLDRRDGERRVLSAQDCGFAYRDSHFKSSWPERYVILAVQFRLVPGGPPALRYPELQRRAAEAGSSGPSLAEVRRMVLELRRSKSMLLDPSDPNATSAGSFFTNPILDSEGLVAVEAALERCGIDAGTMPRYAAGPGRTKLPAAWLIERAGFTKGQRLGPAGISARHSLALVNCGGARASDILALAAAVRGGVRDSLGVTLEPEPRFIGFGRSPAELLDEGIERD